MMRSFCLPVALSLGFLAGQPLLADSVLRFPTVSLDRQLLTGLAVVNPNPFAIRVNFSAYGEDGELVEGEGLRNPRLLTVFAGQQLARVSSEIFGAVDMGQVAWCEVTSQADGLTGFFLVLDSDLTVLDGADLPRASNQLLFPDVRMSAGFDTELILVNVGEAAAQVELRLAGAQPVERMVEIPPRGVRSLEASSLFGVLQPSPSLVTVDSDEELIGFEFLRGPNDFSGLNAQPLELGRSQAFFPQFVVGGGFQARTTIANLCQEELEVEFTAFQAGGRPFAETEVTENPVTASLPPSGLSVDLVSLFGFSGNGTHTGWLKVTAAEPCLIGVLSYELPAAGAFASVLGEGTGRQEFVFSHIATSLGFFTGVAKLNSSTLSANVEVAAVRPDGTLIESTHFVLRPGERSSRLITEYLEEAAGQTGGIIWFQSDVPLRSTSLFGSNDLSVLANVPPQQLPQDYEPPDLPVRPSLTPLLAAVASNGEVDFDYVGSGNPRWTVEGIEGGNDLLGNIDVRGIYRAPDGQPEVNPLTITATVGDTETAATVDVLPVRTLLEGLGDVQAVAYLPVDGALYTAEQSAQIGLSRTPAGTAPAAGIDLFRNTEAGRELLFSFEGVDITAMLPLLGRDEQEYLLLADRISGDVVRLNLRDGSTRVIAEQADEPVQMMLDPLTGDLLVAERNRLSTATKAHLNLGIPGPAGAFSPARLPANVLVSGLSPLGVAVNSCTGNYYLAVDEGAFLEFERETLQEVQRIEGLDPGPALALIREGLDCPGAVHVLVLGAEGEFVLIDPSSGSLLPWEANGQEAFFPGLIPTGSGLSPAGVYWLEEETALRRRVRLAVTEQIYQAP